MIAIALYNRSHLHYTIPMQYVGEFLITVCFRCVSLIYDLFAFGVMFAVCVLLVPLNG